MTRDVFIGIVATAAVKNYPVSKILPSLVIAQAILESNWGNSLLASKYKNLFGIKGASSSGTVTLATVEHEGVKNVPIKAGFRVYESFAESIEDHGNFLQTARYKKVRQTVNYKDACVYIKEAGYATDRNYTNLLINLIEQHKLYLYDDKVLGGDDMDKVKAIIQGKEYDAFLKDNKVLVYAADLDAYNKNWDNKNKVITMQQK